MTLATLPGVRTKGERRPRAAIAMQRVSRLKADVTAFVTGGHSEALIHGVRSGSIDPGNLFTRHLWHPASP